MEHDVPRNFFVRSLFYLRIFSMGRKKALEILKNEEEMFRHYFGSVKRTTSATGRSKVLTARIRKKGVAKCNASTAPDESCQPQEVGRISHNSL
jgi:hypothetical protein